MAPRSFTSSSALDQAQATLNAFDIRRNALQRDARSNAAWAAADRERVGW